MPIIVCFSYGLDPDGGFGKVNEARCEKAARLYERLKSQYRGRTWLVATAGMIPDFSQQKEPLGVMQRKSLQKNGIPRLRIWPSEKELLFCEKNVLSTAAEIEAAVEIARSKGLVGPFYAVSHWFHLPRILWFGWWRGVYFHLVPVFRSTPWRSVGAECVKWLVALADPLEANGIGKRATQWAREHQIW